MTWPVMNDFADYKFGSAQVSSLWLNGVRVWPPSGTGTFEFDVYPQTWTAGGGTQQVQWDMATLTGDLGPIDLDTAAVGSDEVATSFVVPSWAEITAVEFDLTWDVTGSQNTRMFIIGDSPFQFQRRKTTPPPTLSASLSASVAASELGDTGSLPIVGPSTVSAQFNNNVTATTLHTTAGHLLVSWSS